VFLDRDGVLLRDVGPLARREDVRILPGVVAALALLRRAGWTLVVVSNQTVVARGVLDEAGMCELHREIERMLVGLGAPALDAFYYCPHHPRATRPEYRMQCGCRKPEPGLLLRACGDLDLDPRASVMIGDRPSDIAAGLQAGCATIMVQTGRHRDAPIESARPFRVPRPDHECADLLGAARLLATEAA